MTADPSFSHYVHTPQHRVRPYFLNQELKSETDHQNYYGSYQVQLAKHEVSRALALIGYGITVLSLFLTISSHPCLFLCPHTPDGSPPFHTDCPQPSLSQVTLLEDHVFYTIH